MSLACQAVGGINLGQGVCDLPTPLPVAAGATAAIAEHKAIYAPPAGVPELRAAVARKIERSYGLTYDPQTEIAITSGATGGFAAAVLALVAAAVLGAGCAADLPDGVYACTDGAGCPDGWRCFPDDRCYSPSFAGLPLYAMCDLDTDCMSGECVRAFDEDAEFGQCSESCSSSEDCPSDGVCADGMGCLASCSATSACTNTELQSCVVVPMTPGETACVEFTSEDYSGRRTCTGSGSGDCPSGAMCLRAMALDNVGICVWPCSPGGGCPPGGTCEEIPTNIAPTMPRHACLATCDNMPNACGSPMLTCAPFPSASRHCAPTGWLD